MIAPNVISVFCPYSSQAQTTNPVDALTLTPLTTYSIMSPVLHGMVLKHNIHFCRCEEGNPAACVVDGTCFKHFPYASSDNESAADNLHESDSIASSGSESVSVNLQESDSTASSDRESESSLEGFIDTTEPTLTLLQEKTLMRFFPIMCKSRIEKGV